MSEQIMETSKQSLSMLVRQGWQFATERKEIRYIESGVAGEIIDYVSYLLIFWSTGWLYTANSISYILSGFCGFMFHKYWSFKGEQQFRGRHQLVAYASMSAANFFISNILVGFFVYGIHVYPWLAKLLAIFITAIWSFLLSNYVIFRHKAEPAAE